MQNSDLCGTVLLDFPTNINRKLHMNTENSKYRHPVPSRYHEPLYIGELDRRDNRIDFKVPPVVVQSPREISEYKQAIFAEHIDAESLPMIYNDDLSFIVLRPTALPYRTWLKEEVEIAGLLIHEEFEIKNFMRFSDILYVLKKGTEFHWQWRVIMRALHESGTQDQNRAFAFVLKNSDDRIQSHEQLNSLKKRVRQDMGETPVIVKSKGIIEIALGIHHLHVSEFERVQVEYNTLMHARNMTSVFAQ